MTQQYRIWDRKTCKYLDSKTHYINGEGQCLDFSELDPGIVENFDVDYYSGVDSINGEPIFDNTYVYDSVGRISLIQYDKTAHQWILKPVCCYQGDASAPVLGENWCVLGNCETNLYPVHRSLFFTTLLNYREEEHLGIQPLKLIKLVEARIGVPAKEDVKTPLSEVLDNMMVPLSIGDCTREFSKIDVLEWLYSTNPDDRNTGRTTLLAYVSLKNAILNPGYHTYFTDHAFSYSGDEWLSTVIQDMWEKAGGSKSAYQIRIETGEESFVTITERGV